MTLLNISALKINTFWIFRKRSLPQVKILSGLEFKQDENETCNCTLRKIGRIKDQTIIIHI
jgi:hypothetical protein